MSPPLWFANFFSYCLQLVWVVLVGTALPAVFRLRAPRVLLAYWQGVLVACLMLPVLQPWKSPAGTYSTGDGGVSISLQGVSAGAAGVHSSSVYTAIAGMLLGGMLVRLAWLALGLRRLQAVRRAAQTFDPLPDCVRELESRFRVSPAWYLSPRMESPATFGVRPPSILLPERFRSLSEAFQRGIAGHELLHVARRDWILNLVEELILTVFWFHPAVAWVINRIRLSREQTVDAEVVRLLSARKPYMSALLEIASGSPGPALGAAPTFLKERQLAHRIELLVKEVTMSKARLILSLTAIVGLLILAGGVGAWAFPLRAPAQAAKAGGQPQEKEITPYAFAAIQPVTQVAVVYPLEAQKAGIQGNVRLRVTINTDGSVMDIQVLSGPPQLVKAALEAVQRWRYSPSKEVRVTIVTIAFVLPRTGAAPPPKPTAKNLPPLVPPLLKPLSAVRPLYPDAAKAAGIEGPVTLRATIEKDGSVSNLEVLMGDPELAKAAIDAVRQWRYPPMEKAAVTDVTLNFSLPKGGEEESAVTPPLPIYKPEPFYTKEARGAKLEGTVHLSVTVEADGTVSDVKVTQPLGKGLDESAVNTVKTWKFLPAMKAGQPVAWTGMVEVSFRFF
jgi:TonB family protein